MLESFHLQRSEALINACWQEKTALTRRQLGLAPTRLMRPEVIGDRSRLDLLWNGKELGVYTPGRSFLRVDFPDTVSAGIARMMQDFLDSKCPLDRAGIRFRSGKDDLNGLWIDTANENIRKILESGTWLEGFLAKGWTLEIGQKRKQVVAVSGDSGRAVTLAPATPHCWLPSFDENNEEIPLESLVALFSQPGPEVNRALIATGFELLEDHHVGKVTWAEWGAGYGNLSAAYASKLGMQGWVSEFDPTAAELLEANAQKFFPKLKRERAAANDRDSATETAAQNADLWLIDPPRSGFAELLWTLKELPQTPRWVMAYHCHHEGLSKDNQALKECSYSLKAWSSVDAFPATPHHEVISLWEKAES